MRALAEPGGALDVDLVFRAAAGDAGPLAGLLRDERLDALVRELPTVCVVPGTAGEPVDVESWLAGPCDLAALDRRVDALAARRELVLRLRGDGERVAAAALEVATRCQRWADRRNALSRRPAFDAVLALHRELYRGEQAGADRPLVRADHRHALDTWQWVLRLQPLASLALQLAALFHDVERLESESEERREQHAADYDAFKRAHARRGAEIAAALLADAGVPVAVTRRTAALIAAHEEPGDDPAAAILAEADALSFFSLNSDGYLDYFGTEPARRKLAWTLRRLGPQGLACLPTIRLRADVATLLAEARAHAHSIAVLAAPPLEMAR